MPQTSGTPNPGMSTPPGAASTARLPEWPLVGRDDEFAVAREAIMSHGGVVLTGGAGVGKTRLAWELLAVVSVRSGRPPPDSIVALWKDGPAPLIVLQALSRQEAESLVTSVLDGPIEGTVFHRLWELSGGNARFLRELVRHGIESGGLRRERGLWRWPGGFEPGDRLQDIVAVYIGALDARNGPRSNWWRWGSRSRSCVCGTWASVAPSSGSSVAVD